MLEKGLVARCVHTWLHLLSLPGKKTKTKTIRTKKTVDLKVPSRTSTLCIACLGACKLCSMTVTGRPMIETLETMAKDGAQDGPKTTPFDILRTRSTSCQIYTHYLKIVHVSHYLREKSSCIFLISKDSKYSVYVSRKTLQTR